jgi:hypothetical protein
MKINKCLYNKKFLFITYWLFIILYACIFLSLFFVNITKEYIVFQFIWGLLSASLVYYYMLRCSSNESNIIRTRIELLQKHNDTLKETIKILESSETKTEKLSENIAVYSQLIKSLGISSADGIMNFVLEATEKDSVFLIRINHDKSTWSFKIVGVPTHVNMAVGVFQLAIQKIEQTASYNGIIRKPKTISN